MKAVTNLAVRFGFKRASIFGEEPPYPNPKGYEITDAGVPIVPQDDVVTGGLIGNKTVFGGGEIVSGSGDDSFVIRKEFGAPTVREGDMFAFANQREGGPALVFEVVEAGKGRGAYIVETQDVGYLALKDSSEES